MFSIKYWFHICVCSKSVWHQASQPDIKTNKHLVKQLKSRTHLCCLRLSCLLKLLPHTSQLKVNSGLLCVLSWIIKLYGFVNLLWQYLQMNSHFARIFLLNCPPLTSLSICIIANILLRFIFYIAYLDQYILDANGFFFIYLLKFSQQMLLRMCLLFVHTGTRMRWLAFPDRVSNDDCLIVYFY